MNGGVWASVIILTTFLAFVVRELAGHRLSLGRNLWMAGAWIAIIAVLVLIFTRFPLQEG